MAASPSFFTHVAMTEDGYEAQFQVNHLSHLLVTLELLPVMVATASQCHDCRIVLVSSDVHANGSFVPGNMNAEQSYSRLKFYCNSKLFIVRMLFMLSCPIHMSTVLIQVMTMYALQRRLQATGITVSSLHPGVVSGTLLRQTGD